MSAASPEDNPGDGDSGASPPRPIPPPPTIKDSDAAPTYGDASTTAGSTRTGGAKHPLDRGDDLPRSSGCRKGCGCTFAVFAIVVLLAVALVVVVGWWGPGRFVQEGYEVVRLEEPMTTITEIPAEPTYYIGEHIRFHFQTDCRTPIAAIASRRIEVAGDFLEPASFFAPTVILTSAARFAEDIEIQAVEFEDRGATLKGERTGYIGREVSP